MERNRASHRIRNTAIPVTVLSAASIALGHVGLNAPVGGETLRIGETFAITWHIEVPHPTLASWDIWYTTNDGTDWTPIAENLPPGDATAFSVHTYDWTVPNAPSGNVRVRVRMHTTTDGDYYTVSPAAFTILAGSIPAISSAGIGVSLVLVALAGAVVLQRRRC